MATRHFNGSESDAWDEPLNWDDGIPEDGDSIVVNADLVYNPPSPIEIVDITITDSFYVNLGADDGTTSNVTVSGNIEADAGSQIFLFTGHYNTISIYPQGVGVTGGEEGVVIDGDVLFADGVGYAQVQNVVFNGDVDFGLGFGFSAQAPITFNGDVRAYTDSFVSGEGFQYNGNLEVDDPSSYDIKNVVGMSTVRYTNNSVNNGFGTLPGGLTILNECDGPLQLQSLGSVTGTLNLTGDFFIANQGTSDISDCTINVAGQVVIDNAMTGGGIDSNEGTSIVVVEGNCIAFGLDVPITLPSGASVPDPTQFYS